MFAEGIFTISTNANAVIYVLLLQICSSYLCYVFAKFACKIKIQEFSFSLPLNLAGPASVAIAIWLTTVRGANVCAFHTFVPDYMGLIVSDDNNFSDIIISDKLWLWPIWWLSQLWITRHIWRPRNEKNAPTEKLFICPWYCGFLVDQCISMNRRIIDLNDEYLTRKVNKYISTYVLSIQKKKRKAYFIGSPFYKTESSSIFFWTIGMNFKRS